MAHVAGQMCSTEVKPTSIKDNYYSVGWKSPIILNKYLSPDWWTDSGGYLHSNGEIFLKLLSMKVSHNYGKHLQDRYEYTREILYKRKVQSNSQRKEALYSRPKFQHLQYKFKTDILVCVIANRRSLISYNIE